MLHRAWLNIVNCHDINSWQIDSRIRSTNSMTQIFNASPNVFWLLPSSLDSSLPIKCNRKINCNGGLDAASKYLVGKTTKKHMTYRLELELWCKTNAALFLGLLELTWCPEAACSSLINGLDPEICTQQVNVLLICQRTSWWCPGGSESQQRNLQDSLHDLAKNE